MGSFRRHWPWTLAIASNLPWPWHGVVWAFDWEVRIETVIAKFQKFGNLDVMIGFLLNPPPWLFWITVPVGLALIWWDTRRAKTEKPIGSPLPGWWPLHDLFAHLAPHLPLRSYKKNEGGGIVQNVDPRWNPIGQIVLKPLSLGTLRAIGRQRQINGRKLQAAPIPAEFWRDAKFTYWFLDAGPSEVWDASNAHDSYSKIEVDGAEAMALWPNGAEISLLEAARQIYEHVKDAPVGIVIEGLNDGPDDILTWISNAIAMYQNGKEPLVKLRGNKPPSRKTEEIYTAALTRYDFIVEGNAIVLQEKQGKARYENLTVTAVEIDHAIHELASREV
jgi:hypothetical protein